MKRPAGAALLCALTLLLCPALATADGDPASDVLLGQNVYYPFSPAVSGPLQHQLDALTAAAAKAGFPIRVALIESPPDLGVIPDLFGKPQRYADFLDQEISYMRKQQLLVVMAAGYGVQGLPPAATAAAAKLPAPAGQSSDDLARAALSAVRKLSAAAGHPLAGGGGTSGSGSGGGSGLLIVVLVVAAALVAAALGVITVRRSRTATSG